MCMACVNAMWNRGSEVYQIEISRYAYVQVYRPKTLPRTLLILPDTGLAGAASDVGSLLSPRRRCLNVRRILGSAVVTVPFEVAADDAAGVESISLACRLAAFFSSMLLIILAFSMLVKIVLFSRFAWLISACSLCALDAFSYAKFGNKSETTSVQLLSTWQLNTKTCKRVVKEAYRSSR